MGAKGTKIKNFAKDVKEGKVVDYDKIIEEGSVLQRVVLLARDKDLSQRYAQIGITPLLSDTQRETLIKSFKTPKERNTLRDVVDLYNGCMTYGKYLIGLRKSWQVEAANLALLCKEWEDFDKQAKTLTEILEAMYKGQVAIEGVDPHNPSDLLKFFSNLWQEQWAEGKGGAILRTEQTGTDEEGRPLFKFVADVDGENGLYSRIQRQATSAKEILQILKSNIEPFSNFAMGSIKLRSGVELCLYITILPSALESLLDYPDATQFMYEPDAGKYHAYKLRQRREAGETITPEEEKRAVIPDYNQTEEVEKYVELCKIHLQNAFPKYYNPEEQNE